MKAAFLVSYLKAETFYNIAQHLDTKTLWISTGDPSVIKYLTGKGVPLSSILDLSFAYFSDDTDISPLLEMEQFSPFKASAMIMADRLLARKPRDKAYTYLARVYTAVRDFINANSINVIFGEAKHAPEFAAAAAANACGIHYLVPAPVRIPCNRFTFFNGIFQDKLFINRPYFDSSIETAEMEFNKFLTEKVVSEYDERRIDLPFFSGTHLRRFLNHFLYMLKHTDKDQTRPDLDYLFDWRIFRNTNLKRLKRLKLSTDISYLKGVRYCVYSLQTQPCAGVDVLGSYFSDQFENIRQISRALPADCIIIVKESPLSVGDREREFYNAVNDLPNAVLVHEETDGNELLKGAFAVFSISATDSYIAALKGIPSVIFADMFFSELPLVIRCKSYEELPKIIEKCMTTGRQDTKQDSAAFIAKIIKNSFEGLADTKNAAIAAKGFKAAMSYLKENEARIVR